MDLNRVAWYIMDSDKGGIMETGVVSSCCCETPQSVFCPICSQLSCEHFFDKSGHPVYRCRECGLRFIHPQPDDSVLQEIYGADYFLGEKNEESEIRVSNLKGATASCYLDRLKEYAGSNAGRLLEIGCGGGNLLVEARSRGFEVNGVEISPSAATRANKLLGVESVLTGTIESVSLPEGSFDIIISADSIEHVRDPVRFLHRVWRLLKPAGVVFIVTPSLDSWSARLMGRHWMEYKIEHLYYFGKESMKRALRRTGFENVSIEPNFKVLTLRYVQDHFCRFPVPIGTPVLQLLSRLVPENMVHRRIKLAAGGMLVMGKKQNVSKNS